MGIGLRVHKGNENKRFGKLGKNVAAMRKQAHILQTCYRCFQKTQQCRRHSVQKMQEFKRFYISSEIQAFSVSYVAQKSEF